MPRGRGRAQGGGRRRQAGRASRRRSSRSVLPLTIAYTASINDAVMVIAPTTSSLPPPAMPGAAGKSLSESAKTSAPTGRLTRKIQCQLSTSVSTPPSSTPATPPAERTKPKMPMAFARSACSVKSVITRESATAETSAPPSPCTARAATSWPCDVASPQARDAAVKSEMPTRNMRRCPNRSPSRPPSRRNPPKVSRYALTTQASPVSEKPRSSLIDGSATFTIVPSRTIIRSPRQRT